MRVELLYGKGKKEINVPDSTTVIRKKEMPFLDDEKAIEVVRESLNTPIKAPSLLKIAKSKKNACIVVSDNTRPVPNKLILPPILEVLEKAGIEDIEILVATGLHHPLNEEGLKEILGDDIVKRYKVVNHDALDFDNMTYLGKTPLNGFPIYVNSSFLSFDLKILTGLIEPHFMAGYSGGRKSVCPGVSSVETVKYMHSPQILESPFATNCIVEKNPFHVEATYIARRSDVDFIVNVVLNESKKISAVFSGDLEEAFKKGVEYARRYSETKVGKKFDVVITTNAGYPLDRNYYQSVKGLVGALNIVKDGGKILIVTECVDGLGSDNFRTCLEKLREFDSYDSYIDYISNMDNFIVDQWEVEELVKVLRKAEIYVYSEELKEDDWNLTFADRVIDLQQQIDLFVSEGLEIAVIPEGPYTIPF